MSIEIQGLILIGGPWLGLLLRACEDSCEQENRARVDFSFLLYLLNPKTNLDYTWPTVIQWLSDFFQPSSEKIHQALWGVILNVIKFSEKNLSPRPKMSSSLCEILHTKEAQIQEQKPWVPQFIKVKTLPKDNSQVNWELVSGKR